MPRFDIAIVGSALTGLAAALALGGRQALRPLDIALIDAQDPRRFATQAHDGRASAITATSRRFFAALGVWDTIAPNAEPMREIIVTDAPPGAEQRPVLLHFGEEHSGPGPTAHMAENRHLHAALLAEVEASPHITLMTGSGVTDIVFAPGHARLALADGTEIRAALAIAADGRNSRLRAAAHIEMVGWDYAQSAIVATVAHELPHGGRAEEHFRVAGPFAILPLPGSRSSIVWTEGTEEARRIMSLDDAGFLEELRSRFGPHHGAIALEGPRHSHPLALYLAKSLTAPRLALTGDAAHVIHPIAGLGLNLGFRDIAALAESIADAVKLGLDPGSPSVLGTYARWRRSDTVMTALATDALNRLFSTDAAPLRVLRDMGLLAVNALSPLKPFFMREAAGQTGHLPRLMRGEPV
jgi:2-octaprenyl-6-methoxyphenol hydroxylase